jgi:hypothetical protein
LNFRAVFEAAVECSLLLAGASFCSGSLFLNNYDFTKSEIYSCLPLFSVSKKALQDSKNILNLAS